MLGQRKATRCSFDVNRNAFLKTGLDLCSRYQKLFHITHSHIRSHGTLTSSFLHTNLFVLGYFFKELPTYTPVPTVTVTIIEVAPVTVVFIQHGRLTVMATEHSVSSTLWPCACRSENGWLLLMHWAVIGRYFVNHNCFCN